MARRATFFKSTRIHPGVVAIGGGNEFASPDTTSAVSNTVAGQLVQAFTALKYDIIALSPTDAELLTLSQKPIPSAWHSSDSTPVLIPKTVPDGRLAFIIFPDSGQQDHSAAIADMAEEARATGHYNLIIGLSNWGHAREMTFIERHGKAFDIILGAGAGPSSSGLYMQGNNVLWARAIAKGKGISTIVLPTLPAPGIKIVWEPETTAQTAIHALKDDLAPDPDITAIFTP